MPDQPLAYFLTFGTYGSRLHGDKRGSVDRHHVPLLRDDFRRNFETRLMVSVGFVLTAEHRATLERAFAETASIRGWAVLALNVRMSHVHVVLAGQGTPEAMMQALKANGTRWIRERTGLPREQKLWARHGSTGYLWETSDVDAAIEYTMNRQGADLPGSDYRVWRKEGREADAERRSRINTPPLHTCRG